LLVPDRQRLVLFAEHGLEEGFNQYVRSTWMLKRIKRLSANRGTCSRPTPEQ
jgi:hypothetical protein